MAWVELKTMSCIRSPNSDFGIRPLKTLPASWRRKVRLGESMPTTRTDSAAWMAILISPPSRGGVKSSFEYILKSDTASGGNSSARTSGVSSSRIAFTRNTLAGWSWTTPIRRTDPDPLLPGTHRM